MRQLFRLPAIAPPVWVNLPGFSGSPGPAYSPSSWACSSLRNTFGVLTPRQVGRFVFGRVWQLYILGLVQCDCQPLLPAAMNVLSQWTVLWNPEPKIKLFLPEVTCVWSFVSAMR